MEVLELEDTHLYLLQELGAGKTRSLDLPASEYRAPMIQIQKMGHVPPRAEVNQPPPRLHSSY